MSTDEEMIIRGRLVTEYAEAKQLKTLLQSERDRLGKLIVAAGNRIQGEYPFLCSIPTEEQLATLNPAKIIELYSETKKNQETLEDLQSKMTSLGLL